MRRESHPLKDLDGIRDLDERDRKIQILMRTRLATQEGIDTPFAVHPALDARRLQSLDDPHDFLAADHSDERRSTLTSGSQTIRLRHGPGGRRAVRLVPRAFGVVELNGRSA